MENPHIAAALCKLERGQEIDEVERKIVFSLVMSVLNIYVAAWRTHKNNQLSDDDYRSLVTDSEVLKSNGLESFLKEALRGRDPAFIREFLGDA